MPTYSVKIENLEQIKSAFRRSPQIMTKELYKAIKTSIFEIETESKSNTPVATGYLRASHQTTFEPLKGMIEPTANYATFVHEGTRYMKARPFLANAVKTEAEKVKGNFEKAVESTLNQVAREAK